MPNSAVRQTQNPQIPTLPSSIPTPDISKWDQEKQLLSGPMPVRMTNDFMFKYSLQNNPYGLKGFLAAVLSIDAETIQTILIQNPIMPGDVLDDKTFILDIRLLLNDQTMIDIEMQVAMQIFFPERALLYLCRSFDQLKAGEDYENIKPCIQISIVERELFQKDDSRYTDAFFSHYVMREKTSGKEYSDKFQLLVLSLKNLENAINKEQPNWSLPMGKALYRNYMGGYQDDC